MRVTLTRVWDTLCAGCAADQVAARIGVSFGLAAVLWLCACIVLALEPVA